MRYRLIDHSFTESEAATVIELLRQYVPMVSKEAAQAIEAQLPEYVRSHDPAFTEILYQSCEWSNSKFIDLLEDDEVPLDDLLEFFREVGAGEAREGRGQDLWQSAFRIGTGVSIRRFTEVAQTLPGVSAAVIAQIAQLVLGYHDRIMTAMLEGHTTAGARAAGEHEARRRSLLELLVSDDPDPEQIRELAQRAGWTPPQSVAAVALHRREEDVRHRRTVPAEALSGLHLPQPCLIVGDPDGPGRRKVLEAGLKDWIAAIGPTTGLTGLARSLVWAGRTLDLAKQGHVPADGLVVAIDHVPLLLVTRDHDLLEHLSALRLAPLMTVRANHRRRLAETLLTCLECGFNATDASARLNVHAQTIRYRIRQLEDLFGTAIYDPTRRLELQLAVRHWLMADED